MNVQVTPHTITITQDDNINAGEYNVTQCTFEFSDEFEGLTNQAVFSTCASTYKTPILNNQCTIPSEVLETNGSVLLGVYGYELDNEELVLRYSPTPQYFVVSRGSYVEGNDPDLPKPSEWEQVLALINQAITETNNLNISVEKENGITTITLTKKDGTQQTVQVEDGKSLEFNWSGTSLGVRQEGQSEYQYVDLQGPQGAPGAIKMEIVNELPSTGETDTIYLVPNATPQSQNNYDEYVYINGNWEKLGEVPIQVDLTDYVKNTDYASAVKGGVIKVSTSYGTEMTSNGYLKGTGRLYSQYINDDVSLLISKYTLENVITGKNLETANNKVTSISSSSTDTQYPSAKCVYDIVGNLETILTTLDIGNGV